MVVHTSVSQTRFPSFSQLHWCDDDCWGYWSYWKQIRLYLFIDNIVISNTSEFIRDRRIKSYFHRCHQHLSTQRHLMSNRIFYIENHSEGTNKLESWICEVQEVSWRKKKQEWIIDPVVSFTVSLFDVGLRRGYFIYVWDEFNIFYRRTCWRWCHPVQKLSFRVHKCFLHRSSLFAALYRRGGDSVAIKNDKMFFRQLKM